GRGADVQDLRVAAAGTRQVDEPADGDDVGLVVLALWGEGSVVGDVDDQIDLAANLEEVGQVEPPVRQGHVATDGPHVRASRAAAAAGVAEGQATLRPHTADGAGQGPDPPRGELLQFHHTLAA